MAPSAGSPNNFKPRVDFQEWWNRSPSRPIVVKMDKNSWSVPELQDKDVESPEKSPLLSPTAPGTVGKEQLMRNKSAKQMTWMLMLRAHRFAGCITWISMGCMSLLRGIRRRLFASDTCPEMSDFDEGLSESEEEIDTRPSWRLLLMLRVLAVLSLSLLVFETVMHSSEWEWEFELHNPTVHVMPLITAIVTAFHKTYQDWVLFRGEYVAPPLQWFANGCVYLFLVQTVDRVLLFLGCVWLKLTGYRPIPKGNYEDSDDVEKSGSSHPMVLVQIPMCNEKEVYDQSIGAACQLDWPRDRMLIQVLDDSSDEECQELIKKEVLLWAQRGVPIVYRHRLVRTGYKAGNLQSAMNCDYVKSYEFVVIFDADFQPKPDFLKLTMPHFKDQPDVGLVQARWSFVNKDENLLTKLQYINLRFHFEVEQQVNGAFINFFGFNGTAGIWRIKALEESGGWLDRTTVEDMDIAVRAHLKGWKFIFVNDVEASCELPESYEAYRKQQHRWHSGPMQLFRLCLPDVIKAPIAMWKKFNVIFLFFLLRKMILPFYSFMLFCIILPLTMFVPEARLPLWVVCYLPGIMSVMNVLPSPNYFPFMIPYLLFENTMSVTKFQAMVAGLFQLKSAHEWVVTKKTGSKAAVDNAAEGEELKEGNRTPVKSNSTVTNNAVETKVPALNRIASESALSRVLETVKSMTPVNSPRIGDFIRRTPSSKTKPAAPKRYYRNELALALLLLVAAARSLLSVHGMHFYYLLFQGLTFLIVGLDLISDHH